MLRLLDVPGRGDHRGTVTRQGAHGLHAQARRRPGHERARTREVDALEDILCGELRTEPGGRWRHARIMAHVECATVTDDMHGRTVLVTGGNTGVGKETAIALAAAGADVVFTSRDRERGAAALKEVRERSGNPTVEVMELDLARFASVREFADRYGTDHA